MKRRPRMPLEEREVPVVVHPGGSFGIEMATVGCDPDVNMSIRSVFEEAELYVAIEPFGHRLGDEPTILFVHVLRCLDPGTDRV